MGGGKYATPTCTTPFLPCSIPGHSEIQPPQSTFATVPGKRCGVFAGTGAGVGGRAEAGSRDFAGRTHSHNVG